MLHVLEPSEYPCTRPLLAGLPHYNLILDAVLDGTSPAWVAADHNKHPSGAFFATAEGYFLVGDADNHAWVADLQTFFHRAMSEAGFWRGSPVLYLNFSSEAWHRRLPDLFPGRKTFLQERQHYICTQLKLSDGASRLPEGYTIEQITESLLAHPNLSVPDHIPEWIDGNWGSMQNYMEHGFGFCTVHQNTVVSWSLADCVSGDRCEIGIQTHEDYRRRGLASLTAAAAVDHALSNGLREVGWHCNAENVGSIGTALNVGFEKERDYIHTCVVLLEKQP